MLISEPTGSKQLREEDSLARGRLVWITLASLAVIIAGWILWPDDAGHPVGISGAGIREYGALDPMPDPLPPSPAKAAEGTEVGSSRPVPAGLTGKEKKEIAAARVREAEANRVMGRPAAPFDADRLRRFGFGDEEIDQIRKDFSDYASAVRAESEDGRVPAGYLLDPDERESRRRLRARYLTDREFDAALFATNQANRVQIVRLRENARTRKVGLRPRDQIISINGLRVFDLSDFEDGRARRREGQLHELLVLRGDKVFDVNVQCCRAGWSGLEITRARPLPESVER